MKAIDRRSTENALLGFRKVCRIGIIIRGRLIDIGIQQIPDGTFCAATIVDKRMIIKWNARPSVAFLEVAELATARLGEAIR